MGKYFHLLRLLDADSNELIVYISVEKCDILSGSDLSYQSSREKPPLDLLHEDGRIILQSGKI